MATNHDMDKLGGNPSIRVRTVGVARARSGHAGSDRKLHTAHELKFCMHPALALPEVTDHITSYVTSQHDLKTSTYMSPAFRTSAQRSLFAAIDLSQSSSPDLSHSKALARCRRLREVLDGAPWLAGYVRKLVMSLDTIGDARDEPSPRWRFDNLHTLELRSNAENGSHVGAGIFPFPPPVGLPGVRVIKLAGVSFQTTGLRDLFSKRTTPLETLSMMDVQITLPLAPPATVPPAPRVAVKTLELISTYLGGRDPEWLTRLDLFPFDLSALEDLTIMCPILPSVLRGVIDPSRKTLRKLSIDARDYDPVLQLTSLPALTTLDVFAGIGGARSVGPVLASLSDSAAASPAPDSSPLQLASLQIRMSIMGTLDEPSFYALDDWIADAPLPALRRVHISISRVDLPWTSGPEFPAYFVRRMAGMRVMFPRLNERHKQGDEFLWCSYVNSKEQVFV